MLQAQMNFLRKFSLFGMLSESNLSSLRYSMVEETFYRGQIVFQEGLDTVDKIYLIRDGDF